MPVLSILIPSIPSRFDRAITLYRKIENMCEGLDVEILLLTDNKKRTIGEKRDALKNISQGKFFMFVDDDDDLLSVQEIYEEAMHSNVDVITFKQQCRNPDGSTFIVTFGLGYEVEHKSDGKGNYMDIKRPPFHVCAWNSRFAEFSYPKVSYGEDWGWVRQVLDVAQTEIHINKVLHCYNFDADITEASTEDNAIWKNPNT